MNAKKDKFYLDCTDDKRWVIKYTSSESFKMIIGKGEKNKKKAEGIIEIYNKDEVFHNFSLKGSRRLIEIEFTEDVMSIDSAIMKSIYASDGDKRRILENEFKVVTIHNMNHKDLMEHIKKKLIEAIDTL